MKEDRRANSGQTDPSTAQKTMYDREGKAREIERQREREEGRRSNHVAQ